MTDIGLVVSLMAPLVAASAGAGGFMARRLLATERPFLATIRHQEIQISALRLEQDQYRRYIAALVDALVAAGIEVPAPPHAVEAR